MHEGVCWVEVCMRECAGWRLLGGGVHERVCWVEVCMRECAGWRCA